MRTKTHPFTEIWYVAVQEIRVAGKWEREYDFAPGEWIIAFTPEGNYLETLRHEDEQAPIRQWNFDKSTSIISISPDTPESAPLKCVFDDDGGPYLYYYDDLPHIPQNPAAIIEHHAYARLKLAKAGE